MDWSLIVIFDTSIVLFESEFCGLSGKVPKTNNYGCEKRLKPSYENHYSLTHPDFTCCSVIQNFRTQLKVKFHNLLKYNFYFYLFYLFFTIY